MVKFLFAALVTSISFSALASASDGSEIIRGFRSSDGHVLVEMTSKSFPSGNVFFLGDSKKLHQLELTWDDANGDERVLTYVATEDGESSEITLSPIGASVQNGLRLGLPHVDGFQGFSSNVANDLEIQILVPKRDDGRVFTGERASF
jgi:hypothetical protein